MCVAELGRQFISIATVRGAPYAGKRLAVASGRASHFACTAWNPTEVGRRGAAAKAQGLAILEVEFA